MRKLHTNSLFWLVFFFLMEVSAFQLDSGLQEKLRIFLWNRVFFQSQNHAGDYGLQQFSKGRAGVSSEVPAVNLPGASQALCPP